MLSEISYAIRFTFFVVLFTVAFISPALATPPVVDYNGIFEIPSNCICTDLEARLEVVDWDGDDISVFSSPGTPVIDTIYTDSSGVSHWLGHIVFDIDQYCGQS